MNINLIKLLYNYKNILILRFKGNIKNIYFNKIRKLIKINNIKIIFIKNNEIIKIFKLFLKKNINIKYVNIVLLCNNILNITKVFKKNIKTYFKPFIFIYKYKIKNIKIINYLIKYKTKNNIINQIYNTFSIIYLYIDNLLKYLNENKKNT